MYLNKVHQQSFMFKRVSPIEAEPIKPRRLAGLVGGSSAHACPLGNSVC